ncbi:RNA polymerase sigma factor [Paraliomyxa miuraensis]|uniref:RNA polymerase sigma factor n=1 Tax=Paraliomyxa miuraensis TaxID=376150 RepID=UPI00225BABC6|nr:sigma-70 family RNA polymerase sigma factor [Paraliomyxa miuraensis]MCX4246899.1 sigma-70 family RNA polymerase sigma factor [Paraliomyxa miuraensis]
MAGDLELLRRWRNGEAEAGETLIRAHYPGVYKQILTQVNGATDLAADLTQSVFEVVLDKRDDIVENVGAYLRGIARRKVLGHFRRQLGKQADPSVSDLVESTVGAVSRLAKAEDASLLTRALRSMSIEDQLYLVWTYAEGLSQNEIAERVGLSRAQVNGRIDRARGKLRRRLEELAESSEQRASVSMGFDTWVSSLRRIDQSN